MVETVGVGWEVEIGRGEIRARGYPFPGASLHPSGVLAADRVRDGDDGAPLPELRLLSGETVFVPAARRGELKSFCRRNGIALRRRPDLWAALLEPFLVPTLERALADEPDAAARALLARHGVDAEEVEVIRARFGPAMRAYNGVLGNADHLGLPDLLWALQGGLAGERHAVPPDEYTEIYRWAMALADRSRDSAAPLG